MQIDVELALVSATAIQFNDIEDNLPQGFFIEDRTDRGWGLVIRTTHKFSEELSSAIDVFIEPLMPLIELADDHEGVLRVGIFYDTINCTVCIKSFDRLAEFGLPLEISIYPSSVEE